MSHPSPNFPTDWKSITERIDMIDPVQYARTRNYFDGAVTYLSPYISRGVISTRMVLDAMLSKGYSIRAMEKFVQELAWRDYFQQVWNSLGNRMFEDIKQPQPNVRHHAMPAALVNRSTGIEAVDEAIDTLYQTGYMHNHGRMYTASIACNAGGAHWRQPASWMYYHLLDGDLASNTCSWQWVAGSFSSKKYWCNQENINKYSKGNQRGTFLDRGYDAFPLQEVPDALLPTTALHAETVLLQTPIPTIDRNLPVLLYNHYNLDPQWRSDATANRILVLEPTHFNRYPVSEKVISFVLSLSQNIAGLQVYCGEVDDLPLQGLQVYSKSHPAFVHYPGAKDSRDWLSPDVQGYFPSFFAYWKKLERQLR